MYITVLYKKSLSYIKQSSMPILRSIVISFMSKSMIYKIGL